MSNLAVHFSDKRPDWATPEDFFKQIDKEFSFTLDPCASDINHKCKNYYTKEQDGLLLPWTGNVFVNPPYGNAINMWVRKAYLEIQSDNCETVVGLFPSRTDTGWFHDYIYNRSEIRFLRGRIRFEGADHSAPFPSMLVIWKKEYMNNSEGSFFK